jgi:hypothetical protein
VPIVVNSAAASVREGAAAFRAVADPNKIVRARPFAASAWDRTARIGKPIVSQRIATRGSATATGTSRERDRRIPRAAGNRAGKST